MTDVNVPLKVIEDGARVDLVLNRPEAGNSLSAALIAALTQAFDRLARSATVKVIVLSGAGERIFCAGHDLREFTVQQDQAFFEDDFAAVTGLMQAIIHQPQIVIAKVAGVATAAGLELMLACDLAFASTTARFGVPGVNIGFWCHTPQVLLSRAVGRKQAFDMLITGRLYSAEHALRIGLVNAVFASDELDRAVDRYAADISARASSVLRRGKLSFNRQVDRPLAAAYDAARTEALGNIRDPDATEGIAAFVQKRDPRWRS